MIISIIVQYKKGFICDVKVGTPIGDVLYDGEIVQVEKRSGEGSAFYFIYNLMVLDCGIGPSKAYAGGQWMNIFRLSSDNHEYQVIGGGRIGMSLNRLKQLYPNGTLQRPGKTTNTAAYHFYIPDDVGVFEFSGETIKSQCGDKFPNCGELINDLKATRFDTY